MKVKAGDKLEIICISWDAPHWEFDHPTLVLEPVLRYSPNGEPNEVMIEDLAIEMCDEEVEDEEVVEDLLVNGWKLSTIKNWVKDRLKGGKAGEAKGASVRKELVEFYLDEDGDMYWKTIETYEN